MNVAMQKPMTLEQFLAWEERQEARHEFDGVRPQAMAGGTAAHAAIQVNLITALRNHLRGKPCRPFGSDLKIEVAGRIRYPDSFIVCAPVPPRDMVVGNPVVVFEILSDGSANDDVVVKNGEYQATASVQRYVVLQQTHAGAIVFTRKGLDWVTELVSGAAATVRMPEIGIEIALAELYADLDLDTSPLLDHYAARGHLRQQNKELDRMFRLLPRPGLLSSVVVAMSVASGVAFGVVTVSAALAARMVARRMAGRE